MNGAIKTPQPEHIELAEQLSKTITGNFSLPQQNEILKFIVKTVIDSREIELQESESKTRFIKESLEELAKFLKS